MSIAKIILDTNIVSYLMKGEALAAVYRPHVEGRLLAIALIAVGELYFGAEKKNWGEQKRRELETTLRTSWLFLTTMKLHVVTDGSSRSESEVVIPLPPTMPGLLPAPFGTACLW